jgi:hypothetical protein
VAFINPVALNTIGFFSDTEHDSRRDETAFDRGGYSFAARVATPLWRYKCTALFTDEASLMFAS